MGNVWFFFSVSAKQLECPPDVPQFPCNSNICHAMTCTSINKARCVVNNCGTCEARFFKGSVDVTGRCTRQGRSVGDQCPIRSCKQICHNKVQPCDYMKCQKFPKATCCPSCDGCSVDFFLGSKNVTSKCAKLQWDEPVVMLFRYSFAVGWRFPTDLTSIGRCCRLFPLRCQHSINMKNLRN